MIGNKPYSFFLPPLFRLRFRFRLRFHFRLRFRFRPPSLTGRVGDWPMLSEYRYQLSKWHNYMHNYTTLFVFWCKVITKRKFLQYFYVILFPLSCSNLHFVNKTILQHYKKKTKCHKNRTFANTLIFQEYKYTEYLQTGPPYTQKVQNIILTSPLYVTPPPSPATKNRKNRKNNRVL